MLLAGPKDCANQSSGLKTTCVDASLNLRPDGRSEKAVDYEDWRGLLPQAGFPTPIPPYSNSERGISAAGGYVESNVDDTCGNGFRLI